jgi:hypothetical protein
VTHVTARHHDTNVISGNEVMLRTKSTFHSSVTGTVTAGAAFPKGIRRFERPVAGMIGCGSGYESTQGGI